MAVINIKPTGHFYTGQSYNGDWTNPERAYDSSTSSYATGTQNKKNLCMRTAISEQQVTNVQFHIICRNDTNVSDNGIDIWLAYGDSSATQIGSKVTILPGTKTTVDNTYSFNLTSSQIETVKSHLNNICICAKGKTSYEFRLYDIYLIVTYTPISKIYAGGGSVSKIYVGGTPAKAVYLGSTQIL